MKSASSVRSVAFVDLQSQHAQIGPEIMEAVASVISSGGFILGPETENFEKEFAAYCGTAHCVGVASGTDALHLTLRALGIGAGDEVIVPAMTFAASALSIVHAGAVPVFVDIDEATYQIDPAQAAAAITPRTRAILPVHFYGHPAPMDEIIRLARQNHLKVVEDAAQAHGASLNGQKTGTFGDAACFSFYPSKNLGACGDGGAVVTSDDQVKDSLRMLRNYGQPVRYRHDSLGTNSRLDSLQAAILRIKLRHLDEWNEKRRTAAALYREALAGLPLQLPQESPGARHVYHLYVVRTPHRDELGRALGRQGISTGIHYDAPLHLQKCFAYLGYKAGDFPVAEKAAHEVLSLPMFPDLTPDDGAAVAEAVREFFGSR